MTLVRDATGETRARERRGWRQVVDGKGGGSWAHIAGRVLVVWLVTYVVLRADGAASGRSALIAIPVALVTLPFLRWATQAARAMPLAFGPVVVAAAAAVLGFLAMAALLFLVPSIGLDRSELAIIALTSFAVTAVWEVFVRRSASTPGARARRRRWGGGPEPDGDDVTRIDAVRDRRGRRRRPRRRVPRRHCVLPAGRPRRGDRAARAGARRGRGRAREAGGLREAPRRGLRGLPDGRACPSSTRSRSGAFRCAS